VCNTEQAIALLHRQSLAARQPRFESFERNDLVAL
jgi:hypothetical protein